MGTVTCQNFVTFKLTKDNLPAVVRFDFVQKLWKGNTNLLEWRVSLYVLVVHKYIHRNTYFNIMAPVLLYYVPTKSVNCTR
jgi:hypothetical protein